MGNRHATRRTWTMMAVRVALRDIRYHWGTASLLVCGGAATLAAALPLIALAGESAEGGQRRLRIAALRGGDLGLHWTMGARPTTATQQQAVDVLSGLLSGAGAATLAVAAITILILALSRESEREDEIAMRRAVGASRTQVMLAALFEGALLAGTSVALGGALAFAIGQVALADWPGSVRPGSPGASVIAALVVALTIILGVIYPTMLPRRRIGQMSGPIRAPLTPTAIQLGAGLIALTISALVVRGAPELSAPAGQEAAGSVFTLDMRETKPAERARAYAELLRGLEQKAGLHSVSLTSPGALRGLGPVGLVTTDCGQCSEGGIYLVTKTKPATHQLVSSDTFRLLNLRILAGRGISPADNWNAPRIAVVSRSLALKEFQNGDPIGRQIRVIDDGPQWSTVVGVVDDTVAAGLGGPLQPRYTVYLSVLQHPPSAADLLVRAPPAHDTGAAVRPIVQSALGSRLAGLKQQSEPELAAADAAALDWFGRWLGFEGGAILAISALGSFTLMHLWVRSFWVELGLRRALGARRRHLYRMVLLRASGAALAGVLAGLWFGPPVWGVLPTMMTGFQGWDAAPVARYAGLLVAIALSGVLLPAWRATRATPASLISAGP